RRGGEQTDLPGFAEHPGQVETSAQGMACCEDAACDSVRRAVYHQRVTSTEWLTHRNSDKPVPRPLRRALRLASYVANLEAIAQPMLVPFSTWLRAQTPILRISWNSAAV